MTQVQVRLQGTFDWKILKLLDVWAARSARAMDSLMRVDNVGK